LRRVVETIHVLQDGSHALARRHVLAERRLAHARGVGQLGVVVVTEDVIEAARDGVEWINVRVRVDQRNRA
jgi:hypothetical protein